MWKGHRYLERACPGGREEHMNTTQLECFMEVANCLNFSRAAEHLSITQPAVSHQINTLENELGVKLFHRTSKSVRLTQEGFLFTQYAGELLKMTAISKARVKEYQQEAPMRLVIGCRNTMELWLLRPVLSQLRQTRPEVLPILRLIPFDAMENLLEEGSIHVMFFFRDSAPQKARYQELTRCQIACICAPDHPLAEYSSVTIRQLQDAGRIAACRPPACARGLFELQGKAMGNRSTSEILFCDNQEAIYALTEAGYAFALVPDLPQTRIPNLRYIPLSDAKPLSFGAVYLSDKGNPALRYFLSQLSQSMEEGE